MLKFPRDTSFLFWKKRKNVVVILRRRESQSVESIKNKQTMKKVIYVEVSETVMVWWYDRAAKRLKKTKKTWIGREKGRTMERGGGKRMR